MTQESADRLDDHDCLVAANQEMQRQLDKANAVIEQQRSRPAARPAEADLRARIAAALRRHDADMDGANPAHDAQDDCGCCADAVMAVLERPPYWPFPSWEAAAANARAMLADSAECWITIGQEVIDGDRLAELFSGLVAHFEAKAAGR